MTSAKAPKSNENAPKKINKKNAQKEQKDQKEATADTTEELEIWYSIENDSDLQAYIKKSVLDKSTEIMVEIWVMNKKEIEMKPTPTVPLSTPEVKSQEPKQSNSQNQREAQKETKKEESLVFEKKKGANPADEIIQKVDQSLSLKIAEEKLSKISSQLENLVQNSEKQHQDVMNASEGVAILTVDCFKSFQKSILDLVQQQLAK